jgi:alkylation response protein AidB-like acyl-CoA dehydrogenase
VGEDIPAAAIAIMEPRPLFNPFALATTARPAAGGYVLSGVKALVPRAADGELFIVAADLQGEAPRCSSSSPRPPASASPPSLPWASAPRRPAS